jgi:hypothetical protein
MDSEERDPKLEKHLDEWLDDALAGYSKAEARPGLEQRITATLRAEDRAPARRRWWIFLTPAAAALAVLAVTVSLHQKQGAPSVPQNAATSTEIAKNEPQASQSALENDRLATPAREVKPAARTRQKEQPETRSNEQTVHLYAAPLPPAAPPAQLATRSAPSDQPAQQRIEVGPVASTVTATKPAAPVSGVVGGLVSRNDSQQALGAAGAPPPPAQLAKSEAEPREAGRQLTSAPQVAATLARPAAKTIKKLPTGTVEVAASAPVLDTSALEQKQSDSVAANSSFAAYTSANQQAFYKLDFVLRELEDGKTVNVRNYSLLARAGDWQQLRVGTSVPTTTESTRVDNKEAIGLSVDCRIVPSSDGTAVLVTKADITTSVANHAEKLDADKAQPIHHVQMNTSAPVTLGKSVVLSGVDELSSKHRFELEVTVTKAK